MTPYDEEWKILNALSYVDDEQQRRIDSLWGAREAWTAREVEVAGLQEQLTV